jgi:anti-sigma B factor antagonist
VDVGVAHHPASDTTVVSLRGQLDIDTSGSLGAVLDDLHTRGVTRIVVDLSDVSFCDSTGLSALVIAYHRAHRAGGHLRLAGPRPFLLRVLTIVGIRDTVEVFRSAAAACRGDLAEVVTDTPLDSDM